MTDPDRPDRGAAPPPDPASVAATLSPPPVLAPSPRVRRRRKGGGRWLLVSLLGLFMAVGVIGFALTGRALPLPLWAVVEVEARVNRVLAGQGQGQGHGPWPAQAQARTAGPGLSVALGGADLRLGRNGVPRVHLTEVQLIDPAGRRVARLAELRVTLDPAAMIRGRMRPAQVTLVGADMMLHRLADGRFDLAFGAFGPPPASLGEILDRVEAAFARPMFDSLSRIDAEALSLTLDDRRAGRVWQVGDGRITLDNRADALALELGFGLLGEGEGASPARAVVTFVSAKGSPEARVAATVDTVAAADLAAQAPVLSWLGVLDAPISGRLAGDLDAAGALRTLDGRLEIGAGALAPSPGSRPIPFDRAGFDFALDTASQRITVADLSVEGPHLRLASSAQFHVPGLAAGLPTALLAQVAVADLQLDPEGLFQEPMRFSEGAVDLRLTLNPFRVDIGQVSLRQEGRQLLARGSVGANALGWTVAVDLSLNEIAHDRLFALWPLSLVPLTRSWLTQNVQQGVLFDVQAGLRLAPGADPRLSLGYEFAGADVQVLKTLPPIRDGFGYATISDQTYTMVLDQGSITPPLGGVIDVAGSVFRVGDIRQKPARGEISLRTDSTITAALSLLDEPPFGFLTKAGRAVDLAEGRAVTVATLRLPLKGKLQPGEVDYSVEGRLRDVTSDRLIPGRVLRATEVSMTADPSGLRIAGPGLLGAVPFDAAFSQGFGPAARGRARVAGSIDLSPAFLDEFDIALPAGSVSGRAAGQIALDLPRDAPGEFTLTSDLRGLGLAIPAVGWSKAAAVGGALTVTGRLGAPPVIDRLAMDAPGLRAEGAVTLRPDGALDAARFSSVVLGGWLDAPVTITGRGAGRSVAIAVTGGSADLRRLPGGGGASQGGAGGVPLQVALDRLTVSDGIALTGFSGSFGGNGGFNGDFAASVNGAAAVNGAVVPTRAGSAVRLQSGDAGAVLRAAGIFERARGGTMDLTLTPRGGRGDYDGRAVVRDISLRDAPVLAALLGAISVVGLLEQLGDSGIFFSEAEADFRLTPDAIEVTHGSAIGASLGVSMAGIYDPLTRGLAMQGVISPVYLLNGIGSIFGQRGEGLFGFNYAVTGTAAKPQVSVNPLSILTPGMFREIFRSPPPRIAN